MCPRQTLVWAFIILLTTRTIQKHLNFTELAKLQGFKGFALELGFDVSLVLDLLYVCGVVLYIFSPGFTLL